MSLQERAEPNQIGATTTMPRRAADQALPAGRWLLGRLGYAVLQLALLTLLLQVYSLVRKSIFQRPPEVAYANARDIIDLQAALGLSVERVELALQRRVLEHPWLIDFVNTYYREMKPAVYGAAALALILTPTGFRRVRRLFLLATLIAFPWYAIYPLAPPRLMSGQGYDFVDTLAVYGGTVSSSGGLGGANQFAAMPSMHIGWSIVAAWWLAVALPHRRIGAAIGLAHVVLMCLAVMATANHYWLDIAGGLAVVVAAYLIDRRLSGGG